MSKILIISTAHSEMGDTGEKTGLWLEELAAPYYALKDGGHDVTVATLGGKTIPIDPNSDPEQNDAGEAAERFAKDADAMAILNAPAVLAEQDLATYDAVFVPGGHGVVWDLADSDEVADLLSRAWKADKIIASVCHGPGALVGVEVDGAPLVRGKAVSAFTNSEEETTGLTGVVPFLLETRLRELGADLRKGPDFKPHAVRDGRLITGQNPQSSVKVAELLIDALQ
ncbi:type 1 glutamine amidotransferase domain-containing protein [Palleronia caenipelagi]|uniref:Type 1 glutamine amidotransferase domain-containing protein n=1 Tax=Palleronia caenipelagi TaxID=2489174 RepID=A0A547QA82_9RHOB|nr:type 1 glutamine amidotransferase domain-containing protein [Palleronia caenipelagi]TRD23303.1 type 1 glutamine amidotransferase domain-containing protein [Palleronia caenipelagi]